MLCGVSPVFFLSVLLLSLFYSSSPRTTTEEIKLISLRSISFCSLNIKPQKPKKNRYIAPGFVKLCKSAQRGGGESDEIPDIVFLKHNVERDGDGSSDDDSDGDGGGGGGGGRTALAVALKIRSVPLFLVYRGRELVASFATRDR